VTFDELIVSRDTVMGRWRAIGTHTGQLPGLPPTGKPIAIGGITIYRIAYDIQEIGDGAECLGEGGMTTVYLADDLSGLDTGRGIRSACGKRDGEAGGSGPERK